MLQIKENGTCEMPNAKSGNILDGKVFLKGDKIWYCVQECSEPQSKCPDGSTCLPPPKDPQVPGFEPAPDSKHICYYKQPPYEKPIFKAKDDKCQPFEGFKLTTSTDYTDTSFGACYPPFNKGTTTCPDHPKGFKQKPQ